MATELLVDTYGEPMGPFADPDEFIEAGFSAATWNLCQDVLGEHDNDMVIQLRNAEGEDWLIEEKNLARGVVEDDLIYVTAGHITEPSGDDGSGGAVLIDRYAMRNDSGWLFVKPVTETWIPRSQVVLFRDAELN